MANISPKKITGPEQDWLVLTSDLTARVRKGASIEAVLQEVRGECAPGIQITGIIQAEKVANLNGTIEPFTLTLNVPLSSTGSSKSGNKKGRAK